MIQGAGNIASSASAALQQQQQVASEEPSGNRLEKVEVSSTGKGGASAPGSPGPTEFGDIWKQIQSKYGAKEEKPREIKKTLGKDDFLRIMITQMKHQDPTQPFKAEQMAEQMAQFASVEQLQNLNLKFEKMSNQNQPLERLAMTGLIG